MVFATITLIVVILFLSFYGKIKQGNAIPIIGSISALSLFAGLRDISFGPDLFIYQNRFFHLCKHLMHKVAQRAQPFALQRFFYYQKPALYSSDSLL